MKTLVTLEQLVEYLKLKFSIETSKIKERKNGNRELSFEIGFKLFQISESKMYVKEGWALENYQIYNSKTDRHTNVSKNTIESYIKRELKQAG